MHIEDYLYGKKLYKQLKVKPESVDEEERKILDRRVFIIIRLTLSINVAATVASDTTTMSLMKVLSDIYKKPSANNKMYLMKRLFNLKMGDGASAATHVNEIHSFLNKLKFIGLDFDNEVHAMILLASLSGSWEPIKAAVSNSIRKEKLSFSNMRYQILEEEVRRIASKEISLN